MWSLNVLLVLAAACTWALAQCSCSRHGSHKGRRARRHGKKHESEDQGDVMLVKHMSQSLVEKLSVSHSSSVSPKPKKLAAPTDDTLRQVKSLRHETDLSVNQ